MTAFIAQITIGETAQGSIEFKSLFAVGRDLFAITFALNLLSNRIVRRFRTAYCMSAVGAGRRAPRPGSSPR